MKLNKILYAVSLVGVLALGGCRDQFAKLNQDPSAVVTPEPSYLMAGAIKDFEPTGYLLWFYNAAYYSRWSQMCVPGAFSEESFGMGATGGQGSQSISMLRYRNDLQNYIKSIEGGQGFNAYASVCNVLAIYSGIFDSDINGYIPYSEAAMYRYGGTLTPKYDTVEELYKQWIADLDECIEIFTDNTQVFVSGEDKVFNGDLAKWAKLANSLKLKIAVRIYNNDANFAKSVAAAVAGSPVGYIDSIDDDFLFNKADAVTSGDGDVVYHFGDDTWQSSQMLASKNVIDFMLASKDPRVRFCYTKNGFNSKIVQAFIDEKRYDDVPESVRANIKLDAKGNFESWTGMGEPWVRYVGVPVVYNGSAEYEAYKKEFFVTGTRYNLSGDDGTKSYTPNSISHQEMVRGRVDFTLPTVPGITIQDTDDVPWYGLYLGAGEVNLYLAELSLLGASLPKSAEEYYTRGVVFSVLEYDKLAGLNKIPYYKTTYNYDPNEKSIELVDGEVDAMLATSNVQFTGDTQAKLEKVYLQELMHFTMQPNDQFVTARRSGYPKIGSTLLPFVKFKEVELTAIPRRFEISAPSPTDIMCDIKTKAYSDQGFTTGTAQSGVGHSSTTVLNTERLWQDKNAPQWGSPK